ncbi:hypothetical protein HELRODRAFT_168306 [Helobdella robusta]|uniref:Uncharacterized protein n=1 Tax=Helobdella robusta TaxID=6412 RepID=T1F0F1_HELRO|nr:hypothetical protein HELRODRAFT_168306 [Helobdella robusta]ESO09336.1 hypothetical protein HELRODRAFT_168306 [Helobdella robusta]
MNPRLRRLTTTLHVIKVATFFYVDCWRDSADYQYVIDSVDSLPYYSHDINNINRNNIHDSSNNGDVDRDASSMVLDSNEQNLYILSGSKERRNIKYQTIDDNYHLCLNFVHDFEKHMLIILLSILIIFHIRLSSSLIILTSIKEVESIKLGNSPWYRSISVLLLLDRLFVSHYLASQLSKQLPLIILSLQIFSPFSYHSFIVTSRLEGDQQHEPSRQAVDRHTLTHGRCLYAINHESNKPYSGNDMFPFVIMGKMSRRQKKSYLY